MSRCYVHTIHVMHTHATKKETLSLVVATSFTEIRSYVFSHARSKKCDGVWFQVSDCGSHGIFVDGPDNILKFNEVCVMCG